MEKKLAEDLAYSLGYELIIRDGYFILEPVFPEKLALNGKTGF